MQRFAIKIDKSVKARLKNLCRLCGIDNPNQIEILNAADWIDLTIEGEVSLSRKISDCVGIQVTKNDRMPQRICALCIDKINDFYEFREMCEATNIQTRKLLNLPDVTKVKPPKRVTIKTDVDENVESIFGIVDTDVKTKAEPAQKTTKKLKKTTNAPATTTSENRFKGMTKREIEITLELERIKQEEEEEEEKNKIAAIRKNNSKKKKKKASTTDLLAPKEPNQRERKREIEQKRHEKKRKIDTKIKAPLKKKIKKEPGISCLVCEERFERNSFRDAHMVANHRPIIFDYGCSTCHEQFITIEEYTSHHEWHTMFHIPHKCVMCGGTFEKLITFQRHVSACVHPSYALMTSISNSINCEQCNQEFETQYLYDWHNCFIRSNSQCPKCHRVFIKKNILMKHFFKCNGPGPAPIEIIPKKPGPKSKKHNTQSKSGTLPQNSFKLEPETIIETVDDAYDDADAFVDDSYMDTHFGDSDNEFDGQYNDSIMTSLETNAISTILPINEGPNAPSCSMAKKSTTCTILNANPQTCTNLTQSLLECRVKLEPLDMSTFGTSSISMNEPTIEVAEYQKQQPSKLPTPPPPPPPQTVPPLVISRPMVPPLTIRIKKEVIRPDYGDEFDADMTRNIKQERVDESYEVACTSRETHKISPKKSKHRDKEKKLYKKPALLAIKIKQERMEMEENDNFYPDYSVPTNDFTTTIPTTNQTVFENNPLPIITQIHSVLEPPMTYAAPQLNPFSIISKNQIAATLTTNTPFRPIRIKSEFPNSMTPPPAVDASETLIDTTINVTPNNPANTLLTDGIIPVQNIKKEIQTYNEPIEDATDNGLCDRNNSLNEFDYLHCQSNPIVNVPAMAIEQENQTENMTSTEKRCPIDAINNSNDQISCENSFDSQTIESTSNYENITTTEQLSEKIDEINSMQPQNEFDLAIKSKQMDPIIDRQNDNSENSSDHVADEVPANDSANEVTINDVHENVIAEVENIVTNENHHDANIINKCQQSTDIIETNDEIERITNVKMNDNENVIKSIDNDDLDVVVNNENISPIDFNVNDDSLNFIEQLVHDEANKMIPQVDDVELIENIPDHIQFDVGGTSQLVTNNTVNLDGNETETNNDTIDQCSASDSLANLTAMPDGFVSTPEIDYDDLLPESEPTANAKLPI